VLSPGGERLGIIRVPETASNLTWGGPSWRTLFVTAGTSVYATTTLVGPRREPYMLSA
jgi:gluconolactonase